MLMPTSSPITTPGNMDKFKCGICQEIPEDRVFQCPDGHILCEQCFAGAKVCPRNRCRIPLRRRIRNTALEEVLNSLELQCAHKEHGCEEVFHRETIRSHNDICVFRQSVPLCRQMGLKCSFEIPRNNAGAAVEHFRENHQLQEVRIGTSITLNLADFRTASNLSTSSVWPPIMIKSGMGRKSSYFSVVAVRLNPVDKTLSVAAVGLSDLFPVRGEEIPLRAHFSIKCGTQRVPTLGWSVTPLFPTMNCRELLSSQPFRISVPLLLSRYVDAGDDGGLRIECEITHAEVRSSVSSSSNNILCIVLERVPRDQVEGAEYPQNNDRRGCGRRV